MLEKDMYIIIRKHLEGYGFKVKAEVLDTDITAVNEDLVVIVEMKKTLNTRLIYQGCLRQKISDYVYLAIVKPTTKILRSKQFREKLHIVRRLQLGIIFVNVQKKYVETFLDPKNYSFKRNKILKRKLLKEFEQRQTSFNIGGVTKTKIITAYRERVLRIAYYLLNGPLTIKEIKTLTNDHKCSSILQKNYYNWFDRVDRGIYQLNDIGINDLSKYQNVLDIIINQNLDTK